MEKTHKDSFWDKLLFWRRKSQITRNDLISNDAINTFQELNNALRKLSQHPKEYYNLKQLLDTAFEFCSRDEPELAIMHLDIMSRYIEKVKEELEEKVD